MNSESLQQVDLQRYLNVIGHLVPAPVVIALVYEGKVVSITDDAASQELLQTLNGQCLGWEQVLKSGRYRIEDQVFEVFGCAGHAEKVRAHMVMWHPAASEAMEDALLEVLLPLVECLNTELTLAEELVALTQELTDRYEELNLVYDTQDQASDFEETHSQLTALVSNCLDYMKVSFAALILKGKNTTLFDSSADMDSADVQAALKVLEDQLYGWVTASKRVAVINDMNDKLGAVLCAGLPYRIVAAPILSGVSESSGVLLIGRSYAEPVFTNNDRNLLDVMSRKTSKIVQASYDSLTGLMKRSGFEYQVARAIQAAKVVGTGSTLFVVNVDRMQVINDTLGFDAGDKVISAIARTLQSSLRSVDTVARLGGDEFGVLLHDCDTNAAELVCGKVMSGLEKLDLHHNDKLVEVRISIGIAPVSAKDLDVTAAIAGAEVACAYVKERGGNDVSVFGTGDEELVRRKSYMDLVGQIQDNLRLDRFDLFYQVIAPLSGVEEIHGEILLRMRGEDGEMIPPGLFMPAAERYHLMPAIDRWVLTKTLHQIETTGILNRYPDMLVSINLAGQTLSDQSFVAFAHDLLDKSAVPGINLCFEITETTAIDDLSHAQDFIAAFKGRNVRFSLDDFGTGLSSFSYLKELQVDFLKIDGSFVKEICADPVAETMVSAINQVGHTMGLQTIGEFVEDDEIQARLRKLKVDFGQGYGIAKPRPFAEVIAELMEQPSVRNAG
jgi:diguanylate cyclase (GGDEF)-like protein